MNYVNINCFNNINDFKNIVDNQYKYCYYNVINLPVNIKLSVVSKDIPLINVN